MPDYTSWDYVYFKNNTDKTESCHIVLILNQVYDMHIPSPF